MKKAKAVAYPKGFERKFAKALSDMVELMTEQFENETLEKMRQKDINQFEDSDNFADRFQRLSKESREKIVKRFSNERISRLVKSILKPLASVNKRQIMEGLQDIGSVSIQEAANSNMKMTEDALIAETEEWAIKLRDDTLSEYVASTLRSMVMGEKFEEVVKSYRATGKQRKNHAKFVARNQLSTYNALLSKRRYENLGIKKAIWSSANDERVRPSHAERDGKEFDISKGLYSKLDGKTLTTGLDYNCRCVMIPIIEE